MIKLLAHDSEVLSPCLAKLQIRELKLMQTRFLDFEAFSFQFLVALSDDIMKLDSV